MKSEPYPHFGAVKSGLLSRWSAVEPAYLSVVALSRGEATENGSSAGNRKKKADLQLTAFAFNEEIYLRAPPKCVYSMEFKTPETGTFNEIKLTGIRLRCQTRKPECFFFFLGSEDRQYEINARLLHIHQPSPSWARVMPVERRSGEQPSPRTRMPSSSAAVLRLPRYCRIPRLSPRKKTKSTTQMRQSIFLCTPTGETGRVLFRIFRK